MRTASPALLLLSLLACNHSPTEPRAMVIAEGRWTGDGACLIVSSSPNVSPRISRLTAGCAQGQFPTPDIRSNGTFDVDGTYGIVAGPSKPDPLPPAHYSGALTNTSLKLTVTPSVSSISPATYMLRMDPGSSCGTPCV